MRRLASILLVLLSLSCAARSAALQSGSFTFSVEKGIYTLKANAAHVNDVLQAISKKTGIPVCLDPDDKATITIDVRQDSLEKLMDRVSASHVIVYVKDPVTKQYRPERILSTRQTAAATCKIEEGELERTRVMQSVLNAAQGVKNYSMRFRNAGVISGASMELDGEVVAMGEKMRGSMTVVTSNQTMKMLLLADGKKFLTYMPDQNFASSIDIEQVRKETDEEFARQLSNKNYDPFAGLEPKSIQYMGVETLEGQPMYVLSGDVKGAAELNKKLSSDEGRNRFAETIAESAKSVMPSGGVSASESEAMKAEIAKALPKQMNSFLPSTTVIWISPSDGLPRKTVSYNAAGEQLSSMVMSDVVLNPPVDESVFAFSVPTNATVLDQTKMMIEMHKMMGPTTP